MGFNSVLVVLNDRLHDIENDPEFGKKVANAIRAHGRMDSYITGQTQVISVQHADTMQIVAVGGNTGRVIGYSGYRATDEDIIKWLARDLRDKKKTEKETAVRAKAAGEAP